MTSFVLDASVALRWFLDDPVPVYAKRTRRLLLAGARAIVPALWHLEMANGFAVAERRGILTGTDVDQCLAAIEALLWESIESESAPVSLGQALATARSSHLSAYDGVYLGMAQLRNLPLATLDEALRAAARKAGVPLVR